MPNVTLAYVQNRDSLLETLIHKTTSGQQTHIGKHYCLPVRKGTENVCVTYSHISSSLQAELGGKLVDDGGGGPDLPLHLPVAQ